MCVHHLWVESTVLNVIPLPEAGQTMADSSCAQNKNEKNAEIWKNKPQGGMHSSQKHKARERFNIPVAQKILEILKGQRDTLAMRGNAHTSTCQICLTSPMGIHVLSTLRREHCHYQAGTLLVWWRLALGTKWGSRGPSRSSREKRKGPPSGRTVCRTYQSPTGARLHWAMLVLADYKILPQLFKDVFSRLPIKALMK